LTEEQLATILNKLIPVLHLDEFHIGKFLKWTAENHPQHVFSLTLKRIEYYMSKQKEDRPNYKPIPFANLSSHFRNLQKTPDYQKYLSQARDRAIETRGIEHFWFSNLFWSIASEDLASAAGVATLLSLDDVVHSQDATRIKACLDLIPEGPPEIALKQTTIRCSHS